MLYGRIMKKQKQKHCSDPDNITQLWTLGTAGGTLPDDLKLHSDLCVIKNSIAGGQNHALLIRTKMNPKTNSQSVQGG